MCAVHGTNFACQNLGPPIGRGRANWPDHDQQHYYHHAPTVKPEAATAVFVAPDDEYDDVRYMLSCI